MATMNKFFTRIPNDVLDGLCRLQLSGSEMRIILYIIRRTYGFSRDFAEIPLSEIASVIGMSVPNISRTLKKMADMNLIERHAARGVHPQTISLGERLNSYQEQQLSETTTVAENDNPVVIRNDNPPLAENDNPTVIENDNHTYKGKKKDIKERERKPRGPYGNVLLSDEQFGSLVSDHGKSNTEDYIRKVDSYMQSTGRSYSDHEAVIRKWMTDDGVKKDGFDMSKYEFFINRF
ncbi:MAG: replication protein [Ruminococcus sp.]|nr:replication protein [Ruminococcus sp.]